MKLLSILLLLSISSLAFADTVNTRQYKCEELNEILDTEGRLLVQMGRWSRDYIYSSDEIRRRNPCHFDQILIRNYSPTRDYRNCRVGYYCREDFNRPGRPGRDFPRPNFPR